MLTIKQAIQLGETQLRHVPDPLPDTMALLEHVTHKPPLMLRLDAIQTLTEQQEEQFRSLLLLRTQRMPLQYLLGERCFFGYLIHVDERVLIPRQETEMLCELALRALPDYTAPRVLDVCTGSGAIAITIQKEYSAAEVTAVDVSADALAVACENAASNNAAIRFLQGDLLNPVQGEKFDIILSNPPYVQSTVCDHLQPEVMLEPRLALDGGTDGLDFYRRLANESPSYLNEQGMLMMEIGEEQANAVMCLLRDTGCFANICAHKDLYEKERFVTARFEAFPT